MPDRAGNHGDQRGQASGMTRASAPLRPRSAQQQRPVDPSFPSSVLRITGAEAARVELAVVADEVRRELCCQVCQGRPVDVGGMRAGEGHLSGVPVEADRATSRADPGEQGLPADVGQVEVPVFSEGRAGASEGDPLIERDRVLLAVHRVRCPGDVEFVSHGRDHSPGL